MTIYYKATRPDGTDFYSGTINYAAALETGEVIRHHADKQIADDASTYFSVATVPTDCTGFEWPCRLFEVVAAGCRALKATSGLPNKRRLSALRVIRELPAHQMFGPQGEQVVAVIDRAGRLTAEESAQLYAAWDDAWAAAGDAAGDAARKAARRALTGQRTSPKRGGGQRV